MTPLLAIDCRSLRVRRYIYREHGMGIVRLEASDEAILERPLGESTVAELEQFRNPPPRGHTNVPMGRNA